MPQSASILDAISVVNSFPKLRTVLISEDTKLIAIVTEGDIRRAILDGVQTSENIMKIANQNPITFQEDSFKTSLSTKDLDSQLYPVLKDDVITGYFFNDGPESVMKYPPVLLMAGGFGTRLKPLTNKIPKPLVRLNKKPVIQYVIEEFKRQGFSSFYISVHHFSEQIIEFLGDGSNLGVKIAYLNESEPLGTGGCLTLLDDINTDLIVANSDVLTKLDYKTFYRQHLNNKYSVSICVRDFSYQVPYGVVYGNEVAKKIVEKPTNQFLINSGIYIFSENAIHLIQQNKTPFDMPHAVNMLIESNHEVGKYHLQDFWFDIGTINDLKKCEKLLEKIKF